MSVVTIPCDNSLLRSLPKQSFTISVKTNQFSENNMKKKQKGRIAHLEYYFKQHIYVCIQCLQAIANFNLKYMYQVYEIIYI